MRVAKHTRGGGNIKPVEYASDIRGLKTLGYGPRLIIADPQSNFELRTVLFHTSSYSGGFVLGNAPHTPSCLKR